VIDKNGESSVWNMFFTTIPKLNKGWNVLRECFHTHYKDQVSLSWNHVLILLDCLYIIYILMEKNYM
jgi:hypothetical protein